jgi:hypothetical protein
MHKDVGDKSLAELAPSYEVASAYLVHMLEARFVNLNPFMQHISLLKGASLPGQKLSARATLLSFVGWKRYSEFSFPLFT